MRDIFILFCFLSANGGKIFVWYKKKEILIYHKFIIIKYRGKKGVYLILYTLILNN